MINLKTLKKIFNQFFFLKKTKILIIVLLLISNDLFKKKKKNLIISSISRYNWKTIETFFESFKKVNFKNCDSIMFVNNMSTETINKIKSYNIKVITYEIPKKFKPYRLLINYRWKLYKDFLKDNQNKYWQVFSADIRDTIFQKDIFKYYKKNKSFLGIALEDSTLMKQNVNKYWLISIYGKKLFDRIKNERIICAGTVWGTSDKFYEFSKIMWDTLSSESFVRKKAVDQGIYNFLIYHNKIFNDSIIKSENKEGPVMTIGLSKRENIHLDSKNNILNEKGEIAAVIHQYDRMFDILKKIRTKFSTIN